MALTNKPKPGISPASRVRAPRDFTQKSNRELVRLLGRQASRGRSRSRHRKSASASIRWQDWERELPGTLPDSAVANKIGRTTEAVKSYRKQNHIPPFVRRRPWTEAEDQVLLKLSLKEAARQLNRPLHSIEYRRRRLASGVVVGEARPWTKKEIALLGKYSDGVLSRRLRRSYSAVKMKRRQLHIPCHGNPGRPWTRPEELLLGTLPDSEVARKINRSYGCVFHHRRKLGRPLVPLQKPWSPEEDALVGTMPDHVLAQQIGRSRGAVGIRRARKGLPPLPDPTDVNHTSRVTTNNLHNWKPSEIALLGTRSDREVARETGRTHAAVRRMRKWLHIPSATPIRLWTPEENRLLGTMPDAELARRLNRGITGVEQQRLKLGITFRKWSRSLPAGT